jgi:hypothetical protein
VPNYVTQRRPRKTLIPLCDASTNEPASQAIRGIIGSNWEYTYHSWTTFILLYANQIRTEGVLDWRMLSWCHKHEYRVRAVPMGDLLHFLSLLITLTPQHFGDVTLVLMRKEKEKMKKQFLLGETTSTLDSRHQETSGSTFGGNYSFLAPSSRIRHGSPHATASFPRVRRSSMWAPCVSCCTSENSTGTPPVGRPRGPLFLPVACSEHALICH